ncbi:DUF423 domain-containing protein [Biostraticola tofi]|uniref:Uncharacterized membrane protein YgdD (TMEM256/DUF423 family) n=1 Tax=Biostraticola tofi TaxID=466109 RepID=A0A4R3YKE9_9GAMM|nr:DUF423 domain-containing protein [Biostraticola tofi]TCV92602.1 uncharacterized membrane protein YgdD (TMEM256/DUF423 family) [Biostraticola tofi]
MRSRAMLVFAALSGLIYVALGAVGAHVLSASLGGTEMAWLRTGLEYQSFHTLAVLALGVATLRSPSLWFYWSGVLLALGIVLFSGSLYCLALTHLRLWVYVTPLGGLCFLAGWILILIGALRLHKKASRHE